MPRGVGRVERGEGELGFPLEVRTDSKNEQGEEAEDCDDDRDHSRTAILRRGCGARRRHGRQTHEPHPVVASWTVVVGALRSRKISLTSTGVATKSTTAD